MRVESVDEVEIIRRMTEGIYDEAEYQKALAWTKEHCKEGWDKNPDFVKASPEKKAENTLEEYADPTSKRYECMCSEICKRQNFTTLRYHRLDDLVESIGLPKCKVCTYCFDGKE